METKTWGVHAEFAIIFITLVGGFYMLDGKIERANDRTDKLYEMFVDMRKEFYEETREFHSRLSVIEERNKK